MPDPVRTYRPTHTDPLLRQRAANWPSAQPRQDEPSYYDLSFLKTPVWKWQIALYFFFGGVSCGAYIISRLADLLGRGKYRATARIGSEVALVTMLPCAPLLIHDLGDPKRFHHMLRIFKPTSPMSLGTWALSAYSLPVVLNFLRHSRYVEDRWLRRLNGAALLITDVAGIPLALIMASYTGVLLSCTANPLWCKSTWLAPLFSAASISTGTSAISMLMELDGAQEPAAKQALDRINTAAHVAEAVALEGFLKERGEAAKPLNEGKYRTLVWASIAGVVASEVLKNLPVPRPARKWTKIAGAAVGLAAGLSLRWAIVYGGKDAASDPSLARRSSRPRTARPAADVTQRNPLYMQQTPA